MFWHNFKYSLKALIRNKILIFWTFAFPIFLAIFFNLAFSDIEKNEKLSIINIAIIENDTFDNDPIFKETFKTLSDKNNEDRLFKITYTNTTNAIKLLEDKKAIDLTSIDVKEKTTLADYFIITSGTSTTHIRALADNVETELKKEQIYPNKIEGYNTEWILMDYGDIVVHIFTERERQNYKIEELYAIS